MPRYQRTMQEEDVHGNLGSERRSEIQKRKGINKRTIHLDYLWLVKESIVEFSQVIYLTTT